MDRCAWPGHVGRSLSSKIRIPWPFTTWGVLGCCMCWSRWPNGVDAVRFVGLGCWQLESVNVGRRCFQRQHLSHLVQLDCRPTFTASLGKANQHGVFLCQERIRPHGKVVVGMPDTALRPGPKWIRVTSPRRFDLSDTFDFPAHLAWGWIVSANSLGESNVKSGHLNASHPTIRWRAWVKELSAR